MFKFALHLAEWSVLIVAGLVTGLARGVYRAVRGLKAEPLPEAPPQQPSREVVPVQPQPRLQPSQSPPSSPLVSPDNRIYITTSSAVMFEHPYAGELDEMVTRFATLRMNANLVSEISMPELDDSAAPPDYALYAPLPPPMPVHPMPETDGALWAASHTGLTRTDLPALTFPVRASAPVAEEPPEPEEPMVLLPPILRLPEEDGALWVAIAGKISPCDISQPVPR